MNSKMKKVRSFVISWLLSVAMIISTLSTPMCSIVTHAEEFGQGATGAFYWRTATGAATEAPCWWYRPDEDGATSMQIEGTPNPGPGCAVWIMDTPDEECALWLANLEGKFNFEIVVNIEDISSTVTIGNSENPYDLIISRLTVTGGNVAYHGSVKDLVVSAWAKNVLVTGDVAQSAYLANKGPYSVDANVTINGAVGNVEYFERNFRNYGFCGNVDIRGAVGHANIYETMYPDETAIDGNPVLMYTVENCPANAFRVQSGAFDSSVPLVKYNPNQGGNNGSGTNNEGEYGHYYWATDANGVTGWYKNSRPGDSDSEKMDKTPNPDGNSYVIIDAEPDEECAAWLANLSGRNEWLIDIYADCDVTIGNPDTELLIGCVDVSRGNVKFYGSTHRLRTWAIGKVEVTGDVDRVYLGEMEYCTSGQVLIRGNVGELNIEKYSIGANGQKYGFDGDCEILGTIRTATIREYKYNDVLGAEAWQNAYTIDNCPAGVFAIKNGVFDSNIPLVEYVSDADQEYYYEYQCYNRDGKSSWWRWTIDKETHLEVKGDDCDITDVKGDTRITIFGVAKDDPVVLNIDCEAIDVFLEGNTDEIGKITVNGDVAQMSIDGYREAWDIDVNGSVNTLYIRYYNNPNHHVNVTGNVGYGTITNKVTNSSIGWFNDVSNMEYLKNGNWNKNLFLSNGANASYAPTFNLITETEKKQAMSNEGVGEETQLTTSTGTVTLVKEAEVAVKNVPGITRDDYDLFTELINNPASELDANSQLMSEVDIDISTYYTDKSTNKLYTEAGYAKENVSELEQELEFSLLLPDSLYEEDADYTVVRKHITDSGEIMMDVLPTEQDGKKLTFASDKFSTFMVVKGASQSLTLDDLKQDSHSNIAAQSLMLNGAIGVNYYIELPDVLVNTPSAYVKINNVKYPLNKAEKTSDGYLFTHYVSAKEMRNDMAVSLFYEDGVRLSFNNETAQYGVYHSTVKDYLDEVMKSSNTKMAELARAMDIYGKYSQKYFNYDTKLIIRLDEVENCDLSGYVAEETGKMPEGLSYYGSSLLLDSETTIRHYYFVTGGHNIDEYTFTVNGRSVIPQEKGGLYYIEIANIAAPLLGKNYETQITGAGSEYSLRYSALTYMNKFKVRNAANDDYKLADAMANYYKAAKTFLGLNDDNETVIQ